MLFHGEANDMTKMRRAELGRLLEEYRHRMRQDVQSRVRDRRTGRTVEVGDIGEISEAGSQEDIDFALLQSKAEVLRRLDDALDRIKTGEYGECVVCYVEISEERLRVLPFAVRCTGCEERYEQEMARACRPTREASFVFARVAGS
jgi:DnaK suppressor protein